MPPTRIIDFEDIQIKSNLNLKSNRIINLADPVSDQDAATRKFVVENAGVSPVRDLSELNAKMSLNIKMYGTKIYNGFLYFMATVPRVDNKLHIYKLNLSDFSITEVGTGFQKDTYTPSAGALNIDSNGNVGVTFMSYSASYTNIYNLYFAYWNGTAWTVETIHEEATYAVYSGIYANNVHVDSNGNWYLAWWQQHAGSTTYPQLRFNKRINGTWGTVENIGGTPTANPSVIAAFVSMDGDGNIIVMHRANTTGNYLTVAKFVTDTWTNYQSTYSYDLRNFLKIANTFALIGGSYIVVFDNSNNSWSNTNANGSVGDKGVLDAGNNLGLLIYAGPSNPWDNYQFDILNLADLTQAAVRNYVWNNLGAGISVIIPQHADTTEIYFVGTGNHHNPISIYKYR